MLHKIKNHVPLERSQKIYMTIWLKFIFFLPNAFTPNNDEHNQLFKVVSTEAIEADDYFEIHIFNRWGRIVYHSNDIKQSWNGTLDGNFVQHGVYVWKIQYACNGQIKTKIGTVTLIN